jgi:hypothetical protein
MNNTQLAEQFAQKKTEGKGSNLFIEGDTIYSYGHHFPIAQHLGANVVVFNSDSYSSSTARHKCYVLRELRDYRVIEAPGCAIKRAEEYIKAKIEEFYTKESKAKKESKREQWYLEAERYEEMLATLKELGTV